MKVHKLSDNLLKLKLKKKEKKTKVEYRNSNVCDVL